MPDKKPQDGLGTQRESSFQKNYDLFSPTISGLTPLEPPKSLPMQNSSKFFPPKGFPVVKALRSPVFQKKQ